MGSPETGYGGCSTGEHLLVSVFGDHPKTKLLVVFLDNPEIDFSIDKAAEYAKLEYDVVEKYIDTLLGWGLVVETRTDENSQQYALCTENEATETLSKFEWLLVKHLAKKEQSGKVDENNDPLP